MVPGVSARRRQSSQSFDGTSANLRCPFAVRETAFGGIDPRCRLALTNLPGLDEWGQVRVIRNSD